MNKSACFQALLLVYNLYKMQRIFIILAYLMNIVVLKRRFYSPFPVEKLLKT